MPSTEFLLVSSLEKVFPNRRPKSLPLFSELSAWRGTRAAVQLVSCIRGSDATSREWIKIEITGAPVEADLYSVELIPSEFPCFEWEDTDFISKDPGLFPDLLKPMEEPYVRLIPRQYRSTWISWKLPEDVAPGDYDIHISVHYPAQRLGPAGCLDHNPADQTIVKDLPLTLHVGKAALPRQELIHGEWFHADCIASYYHVTPLSEEHWSLLDNFLTPIYLEHGINLVLTPVFTPPLDTAPGHERPTVQLVDVYRNNGVYSFGFAKLARWAELCHKHDIDYLEIVPLFTQWGAEATPKIIGKVDGKEQRLFGWDVPSTSPEYGKFLTAFIPALRAKLAELGYDDKHVLYRISDEPPKGQLTEFAAAMKQVSNLLDGCMVCDSTDDVNFVKTGLVKNANIPLDAVEDFVEAGLDIDFVYYCCAQGEKVPNRFFAMESARNRIMGVLMYLYRIRGFLHWGYNFYYSSYSYHTCDPYRDSHSDFGFPSGDAYLVYPGEDGKPLPSIRVQVQDDALIDLRALKLLETLVGRERVEKLIYEDSGLSKITFTAYPKEAKYILCLREKVAAEIEKHL